jgi:hypothetical protein
MQVLHTQVVHYGNWSWGTSSGTNANRAAGIGSLYSSTDNELFITGLQLEVGSVATPFEHRSFGEELALCQRYYYDPKLTAGNYWLIHPIVTDSSGYYRRGSFPLPTAMRANPTATLSGATNGSFASGSPTVEGNDHRHYIGFVGDVTQESHYVSINSLTLDAEL